jgi:hypothetical protein
MGNTYEFNIEDIKHVKVREKTGNHYTTIWKRDSSLERDEFLEKYEADRDTDGPVAKQMCPHCGIWNDTVNPHITYTCINCNDRRNNKIHENDVIACLQEFMKPGEYEMYDIYINKTHIV